MVIPFVPLPELRMLYRACFADYSTGTAWAGDGDNRSVSFYSRGMWALADGVKILLKEAGKTQGCIWFPDYICKEPLEALRNSLLNLVFYPVGRDLRPRWDALERLAESTASPDVFVLVHYFGFPNDIRGAAMFCQKYQAELLEDAAHAFLPTSCIGQNNNAIIFSLRKLLPLPEGGLLVMPERFLHHLVDNNSKGNKKVVIKWLIRRLIQKIMLILKLPWLQLHKITDIFVSHKANNITNINSNRYCNVYTRKLLSLVDCELSKIMTQRRANYNLLSQLLRDIRGMSLLFPKLTDDVCPQVFPLIIKNHRDLIARKLQSAGVPANGWPEFLPRVLKGDDGHSSAFWIQKNILILPLHQGLGQKEVEYMANLLKKFLEKEDN